VHEPLSVLDLLDTGTCGHSWPLPKALAKLQAGEHGVAVLLNCGAAEADRLVNGLLTDGEPANTTSSVMDLRTYGIGAQILRELGITRMRLLGSPRRMPSMTGYGLEVTGFLAAE
jgi:3,4-dihydroxy 2-butanone 4-phosphate synthase/GTP cyclohydrolase II